MIDFLGNFLVGSFICSGIILLWTAVMAVVVGVYKLIKE